MKHSQQRKSSPVTFVPLSFTPCIYYICFIDFQLSSFKSFSFIINSVYPSSSHFFINCLILLNMEEHCLSLALLSSPLSLPGQFLRQKSHKPH